MYGILSFMRVMDLMHALARACMHVRNKQKPPDFTRAGDIANHIFPDRKKQVPLTSSRKAVSQHQSRIMLMVF
jgi:hypothetical protein